jgi:hypothetical protein
LSLIFSHVPDTVFSPGILGEEFPESIITVAPDVDHFQLMGPESFAAYVDEVVTEARARRRPSHV